MSHRAGKPRCATPPARPGVSPLSGRQRRRAGGRSRGAGGRLRRFSPHPLRRPANAALAAGAAVAGGARRAGGPFRRRACRRRGSAAGAAAAPGEFTALQLAVSSQPALWRCPLIALSDNVTLLREFLLDEAPGSLMAGLRQRRLAGDVALNWLYQDRHLGWLALVFASDRPEEVDRQITHWLQALQQTTPEQQQHYYQLSRRRFQALSPLDQLRQRAFGFAPGAPPAGFADFCSALQAAPSVSGLSNRFPGEPVATRALACRLAAGAAALSLTRRWRSLFIRRPLAISLPNARRKPRRCSTSRHRESRRAPAATALLLLARSGRRTGAWGTAAPTACRPAPCRGTRRVASVRRQLAVDLQLPEPADGRRRSCRPSCGSSRSRSPR